MSSTVLLRSEGMLGCGKPLRCRAQSILLIPLCHIVAHHTALPLSSPVVARNFRSASAKAHGRSSGYMVALFIQQRRTMRLHGASWLAVCCLVAAACLMSTSSAAQITARRALRSSGSEKGQLMADFKAAAAAGDLELTIKIQGKLLKLSEEAYKSSNRRRLLQVDCARTSLDLLPCADFACVTDSASALRRGATGNITCVTPPPPSPSPVDVNNFIYFLPYDYDALWDTDADNVLAGGSTTSDTRLVNQFQSADGTVGYQSNLQTTDNRRAIPNPNVGIRADDSSRIDFYNTKFAVGTDAQKPLTFTDTTNGGATAGGTFGAYWPGVTATPRTYDSGGSEDNVALTVGNLNALSGYRG